MGEGSVVQPMGHGSLSPLYGHGSWENVAEGTLPPAMMQNNWGKERYHSKINYLVTCHVTGASYHPTIWCPLFLSSHTKLTTSIPIHILCEIVLGL